MQFTTNAYPKEQRKDAWHFALQRFSMELLAHEGELYGELVSFRSAQDFTFVRITSTQHRIRLDLSQGPSQFWLIMLLEGDLVAKTDTTTIEVSEGDVVYGVGDLDVSLDFKRDNRFLMVQIPVSHPALRIRSKPQADISNLVSEAGVGRMLSGLLRSVADTITDVDDDQMRPTEVALPEFISTALMSEASTKELGGAAGVRAALLERIFQTIEMRLSDPELNLHQIAKEHNISPRYLQKLFESVGDSFGHFVKLRRLERCRLDLRSPLHAQRSISDILFQWGFNDSASFSRAFREQYGMSPREYRRMPPGDESESEVLQRGRPPTAKDQVIEPEEPEQTDDFRDADDAGEIGTVAPVPVKRGARHHYLPVTPDTIHWGHFSSSLKPVLTVESGDYVTVETLTHHANDDHDRMVKGDQAVEDIYRWTAEGKTVNRRGAGALDSSSSTGRGAGEGFGVHICTGPIEIAGAEPNDIVEIRILELKPRTSANPKYSGQSFGSNAAAYWGFQYNDLLTEPKQREVITIYEVESEMGRSCARAVYNYRWTPQTDPFGVVHELYDYPGLPVDTSTIENNYDVLRNIEIPVRPHFGVIGLAPPQTKLVDSIPPGNFGGNLDNWRIAPGSSLFLPVGVPGALLSLGDPHASQGDSELCGTAIECSMTALIQPILHRASEKMGHIRDLDYPLLETSDAWVIFGFSHPNYLKELGSSAQSDIYKKSSIDLAMRDAFRKARRFLMTARDLDEDEAISLLSVGVDFGITQVVNGNWGVHAIIRKELFTA